MNEDWWALDGATLAQLAAERPELQEYIAQHPNAYEGLLDWLAQYGTPEARAQVEARRGADAAAPTVSFSHEAGHEQQPAAAIEHVVDAVPPTPEGMTPRARKTLLAVVAVVLVMIVIGIIFAVSGAARQREQEARERAAETEIGIDVTDQEGDQGPEGIVIEIYEGDTKIGDLVTDASGQASYSPGRGGTFIFRLDPTSLPEGYEVDSSDESEEITVEAGEYGWGSLGVIDYSTPPPPPPPATVTPPATANATWTLSTSSGYSYELSMSIGAPVTSGSFGTTTSVFGSACSDFDPALDVVIPVQLTVTAKTVGFDTPIDIAYQAGRFTSTANPPDGLQNIELETERFFSDGPDCHEWSGSWGSAGVQWQQPFATGTGSTHNFTVIVKNYRSPLFPSGNAALLDWFMLRPMSSASGTSAVGTFAVSSGPLAVTLAGAAIEE